MTDIMTSQNVDPSSWGTLYMAKQRVVRGEAAFMPSRKPGGNEETREGFRNAEESQHKTDALRSSVNSSPLLISTR
jgi:hypothetical protein